MKREKIKNVYMFDTRIENIVINEHLIFASADFIKVYLVGLMYADMNTKVDNKEIAKTVGITESRVYEAWQYWEKAGIIYMDQGEVIFKNVKEELLTCSITDDRETKIKKANSSNGQMKDKAHPLISNNLTNLYEEIERIGGLPLSYVDTQRIKDLIEENIASHDLIIFAHEQGKKKKIVKIYDYAYKLVLKWIEKDIDNVEKARKLLDKTDFQYHVYRSVMQYLNFKRLATQAEEEIMDKWIEMGISLEEILEACKKSSGISNPNLNYIDAIIKNKFKEQTGIGEDGKVTRKKLKEYLEYVRNQAENDRDRLVLRIEKDYPIIKDLGDELRSLNIKLVQSAITSGEDTEEIRNLIDQKTKERNRYLHSYNIPKDYMDVKYLCPICKDTGVLDDGRYCSCIGRREEEAKLWKKE